METNIFAPYVCSHQCKHLPGLRTLERGAQSARRSFLYAGMRATERFSSVRATKRFSSV